MADCRKYRRWLCEHMVDDSSAMDCPQDLRAHLADCVACRRYAQKLQIIDAALRERSLRSVSPYLSQRIMRSVEQMEQEHWEILPWSVWLPALTIAAGLIVAACALPAGYLSPQKVSFWERSVTLTGTQPLPLFQPPLGESDAFWALWSAVFAVVSGLGIILGLNSFDEEQRDCVHEVKRDIQSRADRLLHPLRHAH